MSTPRRALIKAFTLVEVLIATLFISIALFAFIALQMRLIGSSEKITLKQEAVYEAKLRLADEISKARSEVTMVPEPRKVVTRWTDRNGEHTYELETVVGGVRHGW